MCNLIEVFASRQNCVFLMDVNVLLLYSTECARVCVCVCVCTHVYMLLLYLSGALRIVTLT